MSPAWKLASFFIGALTTRLGSNYVHACTEAVEEVIVKHYQQQIKYLEKSKADNSLKKKSKNFVKKKMIIGQMLTNQLKEKISD